MSYSQYPSGPPGDDQSNPGSYGQGSGGWGQGPYGPPPGGPSGPPPGGNVPNTSPSGFLKALFDFSFSSFITPMVVRFVYILVTILLAIGLLFAVIAALTESTGAGLFLLIISPLIFVLYLAMIRMTLEFYLAITRMSEDIHQRLPR